MLYQTLTQGLFMIKYDNFYRRFFVRRPGDLSKLVSLSSINQFPINSVIHIIDNFTDINELWRMVPSVSNPILAIPPERGYIFHVSNAIPAATDVAEYDLRGIRFVNKALTSIYTQYRAETKIITVPDLSALPNRPDAKSIVSYNSMFRAILRGRIIEYRRVRMLLTAFFNTVVKFTDERQHFLHIPIEAIGFTRNDFTRTFRAHDVNTLKFQSSYYYDILALILAYINPDAEAGFAKTMLTPEQENRINLVFTRENRAIFWNLGAIRKMNGAVNAILIRAISQLNLLAADFVPEEEEKIIRVDSDTEADETDEENPETEEATPGSDTMVTVEGNPLIVKERLITVKAEPGKLNAPSFEGNTPKPKLAAIQREHNRLVSSSVDRVLAQNPHRTAKQIARLKAVSTKYLDLQINGTPIKDLLDPDKATDQTITSGKVEGLDHEVIDKSMLENKAVGLIPDYLEKSYDRDMANVFTSFNIHGMYLTGIKEEKIVNALDRKTKYTLTFEDDNQHVHPPIRLEVPIVDKWGTMFMNGASKTLKPQRINNPICKTSESRVTLASDFNKALIERTSNISNSFYAYVIRLLRKHLDVVTVTYKRNTIPKQTLPYEYTALSRKLDRIKIILRDDSGTLKEGMNLFFRYEDRFKENNFDDAKTAAYLELEKEYGTWIGSGLDPVLGELDYFLQLDCTLVRKYRNPEHQLETTCLLAELTRILNDKATPLAEFVELKILNRAVPVVFALSYRFGLSKMLDYLHVNYQLFDNDGTRKPQLSAQWLPIKFKDKTLYISRTPLLQSLLFAGLSKFDLSEIEMEKMDHRAIYDNLIESLGLSINYLKGINDFFDFFVDPETRSCLIQNNQPTNFRDILIYATKLLTTEDHQDASSSTIYRYRTFDRIPGIVYNALTRAYTRWRSKSIGATTAFSINPNDVMLQILQDQLVTNTDTINPMQVLIAASSFSHNGAGGRNSDTFMINDRRYPKDAIGIISEATINSQTVGINASLSMNPTLDNLRGMTVSLPISQLGPNNILSVTAVVTPFSMNDDGKRVNFINIQGKQFFPTKYSNLQWVRTGFDKVIPQLSHHPFAYVAIGKGKITELDDQLKMVKINYDDGKIEVFKYGEDYSYNAGGGFMVTNPIKLKPGLEVGSPVKKGDILCYNSEVFIADSSGTVTMSLGVNAVVAFIETVNTLDDSTLMSGEFTKKLIATPTYMRTLVVTKNTNIVEMVKIGDHLTEDSHLIIFDESEIPEKMWEDADDETKQILVSLNRQTPRAKHPGEVVKIETFYNCPVEEMSPSIQRIVNRIDRESNQRAKFAANTDSANEHPIPQVLNTTRVGSQDLDVDSVMFRIYLKHDLAMGTGDKIVVSSSLKSVVGKVDKIVGGITTESGVVVDICTSSIGVNNRLILSPIKGGMLSRILEHTQHTALNHYFDKTPLPF